ncbi:hypothetical protein FQA39_LY06535 [Lamprigera yunnana]|nr:hypothetical protein FQA39_LY06535 [Lamprigera yunnana]
MKISNVVSLSFFVVLVSNIKGLPNTDINQSITTDVMSLLLGNFDNIPIIYLNDVGHQLNDLVQFIGIQLECGRLKVQDETRVKIRDLKNLARCVAAQTKDSSQDLTVNVNTVLQAILGLMDQKLVSIRFLETSLVRDFDNKCSALIPKIQNFIATVKPCAKVTLSKECLQAATSNEEMKSAIYCIV